VYFSATSWFFKIKIRVEVLLPSWSFVVYSRVNFTLCSMFSFGYFPGVWGLKADVSEPSIGSIFLGRWRKHNSGSDVSVYLYWEGMYKYTDTSEPELFFLHLPRKMEPIEGSETSAFKPQTPGIYPKENILHKEHGESLNITLYVNLLPCNYHCLYQTTLSYS
jgi:hypothetical protein